MEVSARFDKIDKTVRLKNCIANLCRTLRYVSLKLSIVSTRFEDLEKREESSLKFDIVTARFVKYFCCCYDCKFELVEYYSRVSLTLRNVHKQLFCPKIWNVSARFVLIFENKIHKSDSSMGLLSHI